MSRFSTLALLTFVLQLVDLHSLQSSGCGVTPFITPGVTKRIFIDVKDPEFGTVPRAYRVLLPDDYDSSKQHKFLLDFHGLYMNANQEEKESGILLLSGYGVILVWPNGSNDSESGIRSWNAVGSSNNTGPMGYVCDRDRLRWGEYEKYTSCVQRYGSFSAADTCYCCSCWNDVLFIETVLTDLESKLCIDLAHIHATGMSAGGLFSYQIGQDLSNIFASVMPVEGSVLIGFNVPPKYPVSLLDFRGTADSEMPANASNSFNGLVGPYNSTWSADGFWYHPIDNITIVWAQAPNNCNGQLMHYPTVYDGKRDFYCVAPHGICDNGVDVVRCSGHWGHTWPFWKVAPEAYPNIVYDFMSTHPKKRVVWKPRQL